MTHAEGSIVLGPVAVVGLGLMGQAIARRLLSKGIHVVGYDVDSQRCSELHTAGGTIANHLQELPIFSQVLVLCLPDHRVVADVMNTMASKLSSGCLVIDTSTGDPAAASSLGAECAARDIDYLDASISGSSAQVSKGEVIAMVGGTEVAYRRSLPVLNTFVKESLYVGRWGNGAKMKLVSNLVLGLNRAALAEGLAFASSLDLDLENALEVLRKSMAYSRIMDTKGEKMIRADFSAQAKLSQHLKDVRLMIDASKIELPLSLRHRELLEKAIAMGFGELDNSSIIRAIQ